MTHFERYAEPIKISPLPTFHLWPGGKICMIFPDVYSEHPFSSQPTSTLMTWSYEENG